MVGENREDGTAYISGGATRTFYVPFQFFFNRNAGLALPLIA